VHADYALRLGYGGGDRGNGEGGGVGGEDRVGPAGLRQLPEQLPLQPQVFRGSLDDEVAAMEVVEPGSGPEQGRGALGILGAPSLTLGALLEPRAQAPLACRQRLGDRVVQPGFELPEAGDLGDPGAHRAGANHADDRRLARQRVSAQPGWSVPGSPDCTSPSQ
jgi:hypothetical protein